jgi:hypothetical protein
VPDSPLAIGPWATVNSVGARPALGCCRVGVTSGHLRRIGLDQFAAGDVLTVTRLDRLARSISDFFEYWWLTDFIKSCNNVSRIGEVYGTFFDIRLTRRAAKS